MQMQTQAHELTDAKARDREMIDALVKAQDDYEASRIEDVTWGEGPGHRSTVACRDSAALEAFGETVGNALWTLYRDCEDEPGHYDPADAFHDFLPGPAIVAAAARLALHRKRHERTLRQARLTADLAMEQPA